MDDTGLRDTKAFSFGTPFKETSKYETYISPITGKSVRFVRTPEEGDQARGEVDMRRSASAGKSLYADYPLKSPNERLIDIKNSTWRTKNTMAMHGRVDLTNKLLYNIGPREAYVVDKTFDREMNFLQLGKLSHDGELIVKRKPNREYVVDIDPNYRAGDGTTRSRVTHEMRRKLFDEMDQEHEIVVSSPHKYRRIVS